MSVTYRYAKNLNGENTTVIKLIDDVPSEFIPIEGQPLETRNDWLAWAAAGGVTQEAIVIKNKE